MGHAVTGPAEKLVRMANQIASFFRSYPDDEAITGIHEHIVAYWSPTMRRDLAATLACSPERGDPLVVNALTARRAADGPTIREAVGPEMLGELGASDAG